MVQESMKCFPDGIPGIAMPYIQHVGMDPAQFFPQGQQQQQPSTQHFQKGGPKNTIDSTNPINIESMIQTPGTQNVNPNILIPRKTKLTAQYPYLQDYTTKYNADKTLLKLGANDPLYQRKIDLSNELLDIQRKMADVYNIPTTPQGIPDWRQMDPNRVLDKSKMDPKDLKRMYEIMYEKRAIRDAQGFKRKQFYGDKEAEQRGFSSQTPLEQLDLGIRFATGVQSAQLNQLAAERAAEAEKQAQLADLTLKQKGGQPKYQTQGEVLPNETDYTTGFNQSNFDPTVYVNAPEPQIPAEVANYYNPIQQQLKSVPRTVPTTTSKPTKYQRVPSDAVQWDMNLDGYEESDVEPNDYVKKTDGKWYKVTGYDKTNVAYTGDFTDDRLIGKLGDNQEFFGRLQQRIEGNPELRKAIIKQYQTNVKKLKPGKNLTEADINIAQAMKPDEIIANFYEAQKQIMAVKAHKGNLHDKAGIWDKDRNQYINTIRELGFDPMNSGKIAAFQTAYIGLQDLQKNSKFKKDLGDFVLTPWGKGDEGSSGKSNISNVDGWMGNTTIGQAVMYAPKAKQLQMEEVAWDKAAKDVKHLGLGTPEDKTPFWTEDIMNLGFAARNLFNIQKQTPWNAVPGMKLPQPTFMSPDQQIQNILGSTGKMADVAGGFGTPQAYMANVAKLQANAMRGVSNAIGTVNDRNAQVANAFEQHRAQIMNNSNNRRAQLATNLHDKNAILNQQFTNAKNQAWQEVNKDLVNMWTNRGMTQNLNTMTDQYFIDPVTGYKHFYNPPSELSAKDANDISMAKAFQNVKHMNPGITDQYAYKLAKDQLGLPNNSPTEFTGVDPTQTNPNYSAGVGVGYYPQGQ